MENFNDYKKRLLRNPKIKREYDLLIPEYEAIKKVVRLRVKNNLTQKQLAEKINTKQSGVSRFERGFANPTILFYSKVATALGKKLVIDFK